MAGIFYTREVGLPHGGLCNGAGFKGISKFPEILGKLSMRKQCVPGSFLPTHARAWERGLVRKIVCAFFISVLHNYIVVKLYCFPCMVYLQVLRGSVEKRGKAVQFLILLHEVNWDNFPRKWSVSSYCVEFPSPIKRNNKTAGVVLEE